MLDSLKIAIVCDWLTVFAGAEKVVYEMHELFPKAPIYTSLYDRGNCSAFEHADVRESKLAMVPGARKAHRLMLPFMPGVFERMDFSDYDIVISSSHSAAKGIITKPETLHVSYCHSPMRYAWDHSHSYQRNFKQFSVLSFVYKPLLHRIRIWDRLAAERVDRFVANSKYISRRIDKYYACDSDVIYPPVDLTRFSAEDDKADYFLAVGRLLHYKGFELAVQWANKTKSVLRIVGDGPERKYLERLAGDTVEFLGSVDDKRLEDLYAHAKALVYPGQEDFGITPLEAMASGTPVLAFGAGGALETVQEGVSGVFFKEQNVESMEKAYRQFKKIHWNANVIANAAQSFSSARFKSELLQFLESAWSEHKAMLT